MDSRRANTTELRLFSFSGCVYALCVHGVCVFSVFVACVDGVCLRCAFAVCVVVCVCGVYVWGVCV